MKTKKDTTMENNNIYTELDSQLLALIEMNTDIRWVGGKLPTEYTPNYIYVGLDCGYLSVSYTVKDKTYPLTYVSQSQFLLACQETRPKVFKAVKSTKSKVNFVDDFKTYLLNMDILDVANVGIEHLLSSYTENIRNILKEHFMPSKAEEYVITLNDKTAEILNKAIDAEPNEKLKEAAEKFKIYEKCGFCSHDDKEK